MKLIGIFPDQKQILVLLYRQMLLKKAVDSTTLTVVIVTPTSQKAYTRIYRK